MSQYRVFYMDGDKSCLAVFCNHESRWNFISEQMNKVGFRLKKTDECEDLIPAFGEDDSHWHGGLSCESFGCE